jgi:hypothetical protein
MGDFNMPVAIVRDFLYRHAAREVALSFGQTCHTGESSSDIDMVVCCHTALPMITQYWKGTSTLKTHDPLRLKVQVSTRQFCCTAWQRPRAVPTTQLQPSVPNFAKAAEWNALVTPLHSAHPTLLSGCMGHLRDQVSASQLDALRTLWLEWARSELAAATATEASAAWGASYRYQTSDPVQMAGKALRGKAKLPGEIDQASRLLTEILGRHAAGQHPLPFAKRLLHWLESGPPIFPDSLGLREALGAYILTSDRTILTPWVDILRRHRDQQAEDAKKAARDSWRAQTAAWASELNRKAFQLLRGQVAPGTESVPVTEGMSSAPCHVLSHHRDQWKHWWQASDTDTGYAAELHGILQGISMPPPLSPEQLRGAARAFSKFTSAPDGLSPSALAFLSDPCLDALSQLFSWWDATAWPQAEHTVHTVLIPKKGGV